MAGFVFKLQSILNLKQQVEDNLKNEMGKAVRKLEKEKDVLKGMEWDLQETAGKVGRETENGVTVQTLREYGAYLSFLKEKIGFQKENVKFEQQNVDTYREQLIKARQESEMLEKLKEKKYALYLKEQLKAEQKRNDEIVSYSYGSKTAVENEG